MIYTAVLPLIFLCASQTSSNPTDRDDNSQLWGRLSYNYCNAQWESYRRLDNKNPILNAYRLSYNRHGKIIKYQRLSKLGSSKASPGLCPIKDNGFCILSTMDAVYENKVIKRIAIRDRHDDISTLWTFSHNTENKLISIHIKNQKDHLETVHSYNKDEIRKKTTQILKEEIQKKDIYYASCQGQHHQPYKRQESYTNSLITEAYEYDLQERVTKYELYKSGKIEFKSIFSFGSNGKWKSSQNFLQKNGKMIQKEQLIPIFNDEDGVSFVKIFDSSGKLLGKRQPTAIDLVPVYGRN